MRLLFLSNFYPPIHGGGYAQLCAEVARAMEANGHTVGILTSNYQRSQAPLQEKNIYRLLHLEGDLFYYRPLKFLLRGQKQKQENSAALRQTVQKFKPDLIFVWGMWMLSLDQPALCEQLLPSRVVYYLAGQWPALSDVNVAYWSHPAHRWFMRWPKQLLSKIVLPSGTVHEVSVLKFNHVLCVSQALRENLIQQGLPFTRAKVVHNGIQVTQFRRENDAKERFCQGKLRLLYAGQVAQHKGVHTIIDAMSLLKPELEAKRIDLTILGGGHPAYRARLDQTIEVDRLGKYISFCDKVPREAMVGWLHQFDVLLFPSIYEEPLARIVQEAMAAGLVVVGTLTGGTKEILVDGENGLVFPAENTAVLANQIAQLIDDPDLCWRLAQAGCETVQQKFTIAQMIAEIEKYLQKVFQNANSIPN